MAPHTHAADSLHATKYREPGETFRDAANRVASALSDGPKHYHAFREILSDLRFMPGGRIQAAIGSTRQITALNCFASGVIADSYVDGDGCIMDRVKEAATTLRMSGGIGHDFSTFRPSGALIKKLQSHSTGPCAFMQIFNAIGDVTSSVGERRGAQMGVLRVDHPDIFQFVNIKHDQTTLRRFNLSIAVTDAFMEAVDRGTSFDLTFGGEVHRTIDARQLWETIMRSTWDWAEPGVLFIDTINRTNNLAYCETISTTNPCAEQPLPPFGACLLGSFNLTRYVSRQPVSVDDVRAGRAGPGFSFDWDKLADDVPHVVRAMDNVTDRSLFPLPQQQAEARSKRRMGLGVTGLANAAEALGCPYGTPSFLKFEARVLDEIANLSYRASAEIAAEKGAFPLYDECYLDAPFVRGLRDDVRDAVRRHGSRCSHLTSVAPTGTMSMCLDNVSSGVEPVFAWETRRPIELPEGVVEMKCEDYGVRVFGVRGRRAAEVSLDEHVAALKTAASRVDSSVSKTINCDGATPWEQFKDVYRSCWEAGTKGCTTFNKDGKRFALLKSSDASATDVCVIDDNGQRTCA